MLKKFFALAAVFALVALPVLAQDDHAGHNHDGNLEIVISNPVVGISKRTSGTRIAQENIRQRLQIAFGTQADLLTSLSDGVYTVTLKMPGAGKQ